MPRGFFAGLVGNPKRDKQPLRFPFPSNNKLRVETVWTTAGENQKTADESQHTASMNQCPRKANPENNCQDLRPAARRNPYRAPDR